MRISDNTDNIVAQYRQALEAADIMAQYEILRIAESHAELAARLIEVEAQVFEAVPKVNVNWEAIRTNVSTGVRVQSWLDRVEATIIASENTLRTLFRFWPLVGAVAFGMSLYLMGQNPTDMAFRILFFLAVGSVGSIAVVCATSLWHPYPTHRHRKPLVVTRYVTSRKTRIDNNEKLVVQNRNPWLGFALAGVLALIVWLLPMGPAVEAPNGVMIAGGEFEFGGQDGVEIPFSLREFPTSKAVAVMARLEGFPSEANGWQLKVEEASGQIVGAGEGNQDGAVVFLPTASSSQKQYIATIKLSDSMRSMLASQRSLRWHLQANAVTLPRLKELDEVMEND